MNYKTNSYHNGSIIVPDNVIDSVYSSIKSINYEMKLYGASELRKKILSRLVSKGWTGPIRLDEESKISITAKKDTTGLCLQLGNVSRIYADLMKLQSLFLRGAISSAIIVVPSLKTSKLLCESNMISYERIEKEYPIFNEIITVPLILVGFME